MKGFLEEVARSLHGRYGEGISECAVLFPSRRARLFFTEALSGIVGRPVWQPEWTTVDDLMSEISGLRTAERVRLITELYKIYSNYHKEPFDKFYFWGDMLLTDFDTIDKYLVDARQLFRNITDLKELEADISYLTERQMEIIRHFWSTLEPGADLTREKERFLEIWRTLGPIYREYREHLSQLGIAYNGMVQRAAAEKIEAGEFAFGNDRHFVVAGFNALSECEKRLFRFLANNARTDFYWDYDTYYKGSAEQEAGMFVRENVAMFPASEGVTHDNMAAGGKRVRSVACLSNAVQCKYAARLLADLREELRSRTGNPDAQLGKETAVVLTDENLLLPLLYALPQDMDGVNVTMGYPLKSTLAYTFVERLVELQAHRRRKGGGWAFYHTDVEGLLAHPYIVESGPDLVRELGEEIVRQRRMSVEEAWLGRNDLLRMVFRAAEGWRGMSEWIADVVAAVARQPYGGGDARRRVEYLALIAEELARLSNSLEGCGIELTPEIYTSLLRRHLQTLRIPFEGEPLQGVQVMGILETRNLDFENVIILSMSDDNFPGNLTGGSSFVPYNLRAAFSLPTPEHHEGVYAYYFYRLVQRARNVDMLYCSHADDKSTGEPSRYIYQLDYESPFEVEKVEVGVDVNLTESSEIEVAKDARVMERMGRFVDPESPATLSPTAFYRYVACPLRFYFHSVAQLRSDDEVSEEVDAPMFGNILHGAVQRLYTPLEGVGHPAEGLRALLEGDAVERAVEQAINENYLCDESVPAEDYSGNLILIKDIVVRYLRGGVIPYDIRNNRFTVRGVESEVKHGFEFRSAGRLLTMKFAGRADRIDTLGDGTLRVVDYKTGAPHLEFDGVEALFCGGAKQRMSNILQTLLYSMMLHRSEGADVEPALYYVRSLNSPDYAPQIIDHGRGGGEVRYAGYADEFEAFVRRTLEEMYDPSVPFRQCEDEDACTACDFRKICNK